MYLLLLYIRYKWSKAFPSCGKHWPTSIEFSLVESLLQNCFLNGHFSINAVQKCTIVGQTFIVHPSSTWQPQNELENPYNTLEHLETIVISFHGRSNSYMNHHFQDKLLKTSMHHKVWVCRIWETEIRWSIRRACLKELPISFFQWITSCNYTVLHQAGIVSCWWTVWCKTARKIHSSCFTPSPSTIFSWGSFYHIWDISLTTSLCVPQTYCYVLTMTHVLSKQKSLLYPNYILWTNSFAENFRMFGCPYRVREFSIIVTAFQSK